MFPTVRLNAVKVLRSASAGRPFHALTIDRFT